MSKVYAVYLSDDTPEKLCKLTQLFAQVMLKKGFQVRVGQSEHDMGVLEAAYLEGHFFSSTPEKFGPMCVGTSNPAVHQKAARLFSGMTHGVDRNQCRLAAALTHGVNANEPAKMIICWTPDGVHRMEDFTPDTGVTQQMIQAAELSNVPVFNLANKNHRDRIITMVKNATKKSDMQAFVAARRGKK